MLKLLAQIKSEEGESNAEINCYAFCRTLVSLRVRTKNNIQVSTKRYQMHVQNDTEQVHGACGISATYLSDSRYIKHENTRPDVHKKYSLHVSMYVCMYVRLTYNFIAARLACTIVPNVLCNTVYYAGLLMMND